MQVKIEARRIEIELDSVADSAVIEDVYPCDALVRIRLFEIEVVGIRSAGIGDVDLMAGQIGDREIVVARAELDQIDPGPAVDDQVIARAGIDGERGRGGVGHRQDEVAACAAEIERLVAEEIDERVGSVVVVEHIRIVVGQAEQYVVSGSALDGVLSGRPEYPVDAIPAAQEVRFRNFDFRIRSLVVLVQEVVSRAAIGLIVPGSAHQFVVSTLAVQLVVSSIRENGVVTVSAGHLIVAPNFIVPVSSNDHVIATPAFHLRGDADAVPVQNDRFGAVRTDDDDPGDRARDKMVRVRERDVSVLVVVGAHLIPAAPLSIRRPAVPLPVAFIVPADGNQHVSRHIGCVDDQVAIHHRQRDPGSI